MSSEQIWNFNFLSNFRTLTSALKKNSEEDTLPLSLEFSDPSTIKSKNKGRPPKKGKQRKRLNTTTAAAQTSRNLLEFLIVILFLIYSYTVSLYFIQL